MSVSLYVLFESAVGYGLFHVDSSEEIGALLPIVSKSMSDFSLFSSVTKLIAFDLFQSGKDALENMVSITKSELNETLKNFLETNLPKNGKINLGVFDKDLSYDIKTTMDISCVSNEVVLEVMRGVRVFLPEFVKSISKDMIEQAQVGLCHNYSTQKLQLNVNRNDNMVIQSIALIDQLDKDINTFSMRVKEWYGFHFPELNRIEPDNFQYCKLVEVIMDRQAMSEETVEKIKEIVKDDEKCQAIVSSSKHSMGMEISPIDLMQCGKFCRQVISITNYRKKLTEYLHSKMSSVAPSLSALIGDVVGARLISHAGSLTNLAKYPASTVQILGAEKALFRALKKRGNTPKYGLIFHSTFIGRAGAKNKGRISRFLANKCSIASRIDAFSEKPSTVFGEKLRDQVEERLTFYEEGKKPRKNNEVMAEAIKQYSELVDANAVKTEVKEEPVTVKKAKKRKSTTGEETPKKKSKKVKTEVQEVVEAPTSEKKKKKKKKSVAAPMDVEEVVEAPTSEKKKKKKKKSIAEPMVVEEVVEAPKSEKKKKKKTKKAAC